MYACVFVCFEHEDEIVVFVSEEDEIGQPDSTVGSHRETNALTRRGVVVCDDCVVYECVYPCSDDVGCEKVFVSFEFAFVLFGGPVVCVGQCVNAKSEVCGSSLFALCDVCP